jgi:hypothetical protein
VAAGTYSPGTGESFPLVIPNGVVLLSESGPEVTIIDANHTAAVIWCTGVDGNTRVEGFTITNGSGAAYPNAGGGILCRSGASPVITNNIITSNAVNQANLGYGGGIYCYGSGTRPTITDNVITDNYASQRGGGIGCDHCPGGTIENNVIQRNGAGADAGGIYIYDASPRISRNVIVDNTAQDHCGGVYLVNYCDSEIVENTLWGNDDGSSPISGTITIDAPEPQPIIHNNIVGGSNRCGIASTVPSSPTIYCNDVWGNAEGNYCGTISDQTGLNDNISADPLFCGEVVYPDDPYRLDTASPCTENNSTCGLMGARHAGCSVYNPPTDCDIAYDDFSDGNDTGWTHHCSGGGCTWIVNGGVYELGGPWVTVSTLDLTDGLCDYVFEADVRTDSDDGIVVFRFQHVDTCYNLNIRPYVDELTLERRPGGGLFESVHFDSSPYTWYTVRIAALGANIKCFVNGTKYIDVHDPDPILCGPVGLWGHTNQTGVFDNVCVRSLQSVPVQQTSWGRLKALYK